MRLTYSFGKLDPTVGTIAFSQKNKFDKMKRWVDSPFHEYQCNKSGNHFVMAKKHTKTRCVGCTTGWANKNCSYKMCKLCCFKHIETHSDAVACKVKDHAKKPLATSRASNNSANDVEMEDVNDDN